MAADDETEAYALAMDEAIAAAARAETERDTARVEVQRLEGIVEDYQRRDGADNERIVPNMDLAAEEAFDDALDAHVQQTEDERKEQVDAATHAFMLEHFAECVESVVATAAALPVPPHDTTFPQSMERITERVAGNLYRAGHFREEYAWQQPAGDEAAALWRTAAQAITQSAGDEEVAAATQPANKKHKAETL